MDTKYLRKPPAQGYSKIFVRAVLGIAVLQAIGCTQFVAVRHHGILYDVPVSERDQYLRTRETLDRQRGLEAEAAGNIEALVSACQLLRNAAAVTARWRWDGSPRTHETAGAIDLLQIDADVVCTASADAAARERRALDAEARDREAVRLAEAEARAAAMAESMRRAEAEERRIEADRQGEEARRQQEATAAREQAALIAAHGRTQVG